MPGCLPPLFLAKDQAWDRNEKTPATPGQGAQAECEINQQGQKLSLPAAETRGQGAADRGRGTSLLGHSRGITTRGNPRGSGPGRQSWVTAGLFPPGVRGRGGGHSPAGTPHREYQPSSWNHTLDDADLSRGSPPRKPDLAGSVPSLPLEWRAALVPPTSATTKRPALAGLLGSGVQ